MALKKREPWHPADFKDYDAYAWQAFSRGEANEAQQRRAFEWLMTASGVRDELFVPGQDDVRTYLMGRRSIGLQVARMLLWAPNKERKTDG